MSTTHSESASESSVDPKLYVSSIDVHLAKDSHKTIESITIRKNDETPKDVHKTIHAGGQHREAFRPPIAFDPSDHIRAVVNCRLPRRKQASVEIDIDLSDVQCMRIGDREGEKSYRKKIRNVELVVTGHQNPLEEITTRIIEVCSRFRLLIIGNSGVGKSSLIKEVFCVDDVHTSESTRGSADIDKEYISPTNERFVVHDSLGFEAGDQDNMEIVKRFVAKRIAEPQVEDQLHAIWLCLETPYAGGRLLEDGVEEFLQRRREIIGEVPLVVVLTKVDLLDFQVEIDVPQDETKEDYKSKYMQQHCIGPLLAAAGNDVTYTTVSTQEEYPHSLFDLLQKTMDNMKKYHVNTAPGALVSIAQRISIKEKIELSIAIGKQKYWKMLWKSAVFRGHTLKECLQVIHKDVINVWNFNDPNNHLLDDTIMRTLLRTDNLDDDHARSTATASFAAAVVSSLEVIRSIAASGDISLAILGEVASVAITVLVTMYQAYQEAKKVVKIIMAYIVDLICVMQIVFLLNSGNEVTDEMVALALQTYETPRRVVHMKVDSFDVRGGIFPGGRDGVLEKIEELIWHHSIPDNNIHELRRRINAPPSS